MCARPASCDQDAASPQRPWLPSWSLSRGARLPLPPIVKPVGAVDDTNRTNVLEGGLDLATYLVAHMFDHRSAPGADTPDEALRMIFEKGVPSYMAVVASNEGVAAHYEAEFAQLAKTIRGGSGEEGILVPA